MRWVIAVAERSHQRDQTSATDRGLTIVTGALPGCGGYGLPYPSCFGHAMKMKRVRQAVPLQPGRQSRWPIVKS
jgi:hypothetical protein